MKFQTLDACVQKLTKEINMRKSLDLAIETANEVIKILDPAIQNLPDGEDALDQVIPTSQFPNNKVESWFAEHPYFKGSRVAIKFYTSELIETKFYWLNDNATKARVSAGVMLAPNWEDTRLTRNEQYKIGVDFFLSADTKALIIVVSNNGNLRLLELSNKLTHTQVEIFDKLHSAFSLETREQVHKTLWDAMALSEVNKKFYAGIAEQFNILLNHLVEQERDKEDSKLFASRLLGRLLFVWFLRKNNIIDETQGYFDIKNPDSTAYYKQSLERLFYITLNTPIEERDELTRKRQHSLFPDILENEQPSLFKTDTKTPYLNGGLFEAHDNDWANDTVDFPKGYFNGLYEHLEKYNFTTDESSPEYEQVAIDPEMLGRVFESLLATQVSETGEQARKAKGAFYTPREIVSYMCRESLRQYLYTKLGNPTWNEGIDKLLDIPDSEWELSHSNSKRNLWGEANRNIVPLKVVGALNELTILDPACGSGAFPMGMLQLILKTYERIDSTYDPYKKKLQIIQNIIYGVDIEPMAVEISRLRAWLSLIVDEDDPRSVDPLPNLDFKFIAANTLIKPDKSFGLDESTQANTRSKMQTIIRKYFDETDKEAKQTLKAEFTKLESKISQISMFGVSNAQKQIQSFKPFDNQKYAEFFDAKLMFGFSKDNPFNIVIGNPPYFQLQKNRAVSNQLSKLDYATYSKSSDIYCIFFERGIELLSKNGILAYITSNSWMKTKYGKLLREYIVNNSNPLTLINFDNSRVFDTAVVESNILVLEKTDYSSSLRAVNFTPGNSDQDIDEYFSINNVGLKNLDSSGWIVSDNESSELRQKIEKTSEPLKSFPHKIYIGLLNGLNDAYVIDTKTRDEIVARDPKSQEIIKPMLRGRDVKKYGYQSPGLWMINPHNGIKGRLPRIEVERDYPGVFEYLLKYKDKLEVRKNRGSHWTNLRNCGYFEEFDKPKIIWGELSDKPKFAYDDLGYLAEATLFALVGQNLKYLLGILNSSLALWYFEQISTSSGMGTSRWKKYKIEQLPIRKVTEGNQQIANDIEKYVNDLIQQPNAEAKFETLDRVNKLVYKLYDLNPEEIQLIENSTK